MENYTINYGYNEEIVTVSDLEEAKELAVKGMGYTRRNTTIEKNGKIIVVSRWFGYLAEDDDDEVLLSFGDSGFYADWQEI